MTAGIFALVGVIVGGLITAGSALFIEWRREAKSRTRGRRLLARDLLAVRFFMASLHAGGQWVRVDPQLGILSLPAWDTHAAALTELEDDDWQVVAEACASVRLLGMVLATTVRMHPIDDENRRQLRLAMEGAEKAEQILVPSIKPPATRELLDMTTRRFGG